MNNNCKKATQLGMPHGTANSKLHKALLFSLIKKLELNYCFQCGAEIESKDTMSVEHKIPYLDSEDPVKLFFDLDNIAFSHLSCNIGASRKYNKIIGINDPKLIHGRRGYKEGCKCDICREYKHIDNKSRRNKYDHLPNIEKGISLQN